MARHIAGIVTLFIAFALSFLVSLSLPHVRVFDIVRTSVDGSNFSDVGSGAASQIRLGIWGYCIEAAGNGDWNCVNTGYAYSLDISDQNIGSSWTRGLVIHPIATAILFIAFVLGCFQSLFILLLASLAALLGSTLTLIAFACDIALFVRFKSRIGNIDNVNEDTDPGPAFWMTLVSLVLAFVGAFLVFLGRRRDTVRRGDAYPMRQPWYHKFTRRNKY